MLKCVNNESSQLLLLKKKPFHTPQIQTLTVEKPKRAGCEDINLFPKPNLFCFHGSYVEISALPPPRCLVDIPDSVSSLCLELLSGQLGLRQHDPSSSPWPLTTLLCIYTASVCVVLVHLIHTPVLDMKGGTWVRFCGKNRETRGVVLPSLGKYQLALAFSVSSLLVNTRLYLLFSGCGLDSLDYQIARRKRLTNRQ